MSGGALMNQKKLASMRKFKFGVVSVVLSAVVMAAIVIVNVIFSSLAYNKNWYLDLTENKIYELSDAGREFLDDIDADITVHFCAPFDTLEGSSMANMVFNLVKEISSEYENITYDYIDINKNPTAVTKYKSTANTTIVDSSVIVESGKEFRVLNLSNMFMYEDETRSKPWAFNGELKLITAMAQCTQIDTPIAYFTTTHGETFSNGMMQLFLDAGFEIQPIDLTKDEINEAAKVIVISSPVYDFEGISELTAGRKSEIEKLDDFLDGFGSVMVFMDTETEELPELEEFLAEWGIEFDDSILKDHSNSINSDPLTLIGNYSLEDTVGGQLVSEIVSVGTAPKTIIHNARPINLLWEQNNGRQVSTAVYSSATAERYVDGAALDRGAFPLVAVSQEARYIDNTPHYSYVFAVGSKYFAADAALTPSYGNSDIIYTMMRAMGKTQVPIDLKLKVFENNALDLTSAEAHTWTWLLTLAVPLCVFGVGVVVWIRRKHA